LTEQFVNDKHGGLVLFIPGAYYATDTD